MIVYQPSAEADALLLQMYIKLSQAGELGSVFLPANLSLSRFYQIFQPPTVLLMDANEDLGLWFAMWVEPIGSGAFVGVWVDPAKRQSSDTLLNVVRAHRLFLVECEVLIAATSQQRLLEPFKRLGYTTVGCIPGLWGTGDAAFIASGTREEITKAVDFYEDILTRVQKLQESEALSGGQHNADSGGEDAVCLS